MYALPIGFPAKVTRIVDNMQGVGANRFGIERPRASKRLPEPAFVARRAYRSTVELISAMSRPISDPLAAFGPFVLGFDHAWEWAERAARAQDGFPPFNVEAIADGYRITLALAGFERDALSLTIQGRELVVAGDRETEETPRAFLHRGIAMRRFRRAFLLGPGLEVVGARFALGLLAIDLRQTPPEPPKHIDIDRSP